MTQMVADEMPTSDSMMQLYRIRFVLICGHLRNLLTLRSEMSSTMLMSLGQTALVVTCAALSAAGALATEDAVTPRDGVIKLFDGRSLDGSYVWIKGKGRQDPDKVFYAHDGMIHVSGNGLGALVTNKRYRDYHLVLEFKWGERTWHDRKEAARDSGLLVHSGGADGAYDGAWLPSIEVQIIEGGVGDFVPVSGKGLDGKPVPISFTCEVERDRDGEPVWHAGGKRETFAGKALRRVNWYGRSVDWADAKDFRGPRDLDSPHGQWTRLDVRCDGGHIETFVNGVKANEAFDVEPRAGQLQLQTEMAEIFFRRWELWPLDQGPKPSPAELMPAEQVDE